ncbi:AAA family ATPase [Rossellomorea marisflavi]|uniref:AAA domain-containing protein n=1 Tax=Rossellomorea marisflavi TaxID=189381 RepID=UPI0020416E32|nr:AAA domain-containing protein [Rossellomorea marisflavi]MCM2603980.1 AAA family ATPase [Rossellomorea marisflavi]
MKQTEIISEWQDALDMEIIQMKKKQNSGIRVENGRCIKKEEGSYVYWFTLPYSRSFPEGGSIQIDYQNKNLQGIVISSEETECIIELDQYLGDILGYARLIYEPWELLEKLWQRLEDIKERQGKSSRAIRTIQPSGVTHHPPGKHLLHEAYVRSKYNDLTYIWGPPGTGKTYTLARVAAYHYTEGQRILILSHSNAAVDVLIEEMHHFLTENDRWTPGEVVRYGQNRKSLSAEARDVSLTQLLELQDPKLSEERGKVEKYRMKLKKKLTKKFSNYDSERLSRLRCIIKKSRKS